MTTRDFIFKMTILAHTARCYFKQPSDIMLRQGLRLRTELKKYEATLIKHPEVANVYSEFRNELVAFRKLAVSMEMKAIKEANDAEIKRMEEARAQHKKDLRAQQDAYEQAVREFDDAD
jgi:predicted RND superfamily exporter protein